MYDRHIAYLFQEIFYFVNILLNLQGYATFQSNGLCLGCQWARCYHYAGMYNVFLSHENRDKLKQNFILGFRVQQIYSTELQEYCDLVNTRPGPWISEWGHFSKFSS